MGEYADQFLFEGEAEFERQRRQEAAERAQAGLVKFRPGQSGNPAGRRTAGAYCKEWLNALLTEDADGNPKYSRRDLQCIACNPDESPAKVMAAQEILSAMRSGQKFVKDKKGRVMPAGTDPEPGKSRERIMDRLEGKPVATNVNLNADAPPLPAESMQAVAEFLGRNPRMLTVVKQMLPTIDVQCGPSVPAGELPDDADVD